MTSARAGGLVHRVENVPSLALDIDTPADLSALWATVDSQRRGAQRTRGTLAQFDRAGIRAALTVEA
jgi:2-phospho-L-lactate guanylyltransferase (CobY/MobA/RfbA family)